MLVTYHMEVVSVSVVVSLLVTSCRGAARN